MVAVKTKSEIRDFTSGNLTVHFLKFFFLALGANLMMILLNTVDMIVVGKELGEAGTSAVTVGGQITTFLNVFINGFSAAGQILVARMVGVGDQKRIGRFVATVTGVLTVAGILMMIILLPFNHTLLGLLNTPAEAYDGAYAYSMICIIGILPIFAYHAISAILRGMGDAKHPFVFIAIACGLNIVLDILLVWGLKLGVAGAAVATVIAQFVSVVCSVIFLYKKREAFSLHMKIRDFFVWDRAFLRDYLSLGVPLALKNSAIQASGIVIGAMTNDYGVSVSAFSGIKTNLLTTVNLVKSAAMSSGSMLIAQNLAAGKVSRVKGTMLRVGAVSMAVTVLFSLAFILFPMPIFGLFTDSDAVLAIVPAYIPILVFSLFGTGLNAIFAALINGSGNKRINLVIALLDALVARIAFAYLFGVHLGWTYLGFWFGSALAGYVPLLIGIVFYISGIWKRSIKVDKEGIES